MVIQTVALKPVQPYQQQWQKSHNKQHTQLLAWLLVGKNHLKDYSCRVVHYVDDSL